MKKDSPWWLVLAVAGICGTLLLADFLARQKDMSPAEVRAATAACEAAGWDASLIVRGDVMDGHQYVVCNGAETTP